MAVRLRLARFGCRNRPFYRVVAADSKSLRDGKQLEVLGYYNPLSEEDDGKRIGLNIERLEYWLSVGAQPSEAVQRLLYRAGMQPLQPVVAMGRRGGPCDTRPVNPVTEHILNQDEPANADHEENEGVSAETIFSIGLKVN